MSNGYLPSSTDNFLNKFKNNSKLVMILVAIVVIAAIIFAISPEKKEDPDTSDAIVHSEYISQTTHKPIDDIPLPTEEVTEDLQSMEEAFTAAKQMVTKLMDATNNKDAKTYVSLLGASIIHQYNENNIDALNYIEAMFEKVAMDEELMGKTTSSAEFTSCGYMKPSEIRELQEHYNELGLKDIIIEQGVNVHFNQKVTNNGNTTVSEQTIMVLKENGHWKVNSIM